MLKIRRYKLVVYAIFPTLYGAGYIFIGCLSFSRLIALYGVLKRVNETFVTLFYCGVLWRFVARLIGAIVAPALCDDPRTHINCVVSL